MIQIEDDDLPITAAEKLIKGTVSDNVGDDMYTIKEIQEIAEYLNVYVAHHVEFINGDYNA